MPLRQEGGGWRSPAISVPRLGAARLSAGGSAAGRGLALASAPIARRRRPRTCSRSATIPSRRGPTTPSPPRTKALADGQQAAFRSLLKRLVPVTAYPRLQAAAAVQGRRSGRGRQGALGAQFLHRLHRQPRLLLPVEGRARPAAPRGHPLHRTSRRRRSPSFRSGARPAPPRRRTRPPGPTSGRASTWSTRSRRSSCRP